MLTRIFPPCLFTCKLHTIFFSLTSPHVPFFSYFITITLYTECRRRWLGLCNGYSYLKTTVTCGSSLFMCAQWHFWHSTLKELSTVISHAHSSFSYTQTEGNKYLSITFNQICDCSKLDNKKRLKPFKTKKKSNEGKLTYELISDNRKKWNRDIYLKF